MSESRVQGSTACFYRDQILIRHCVREKQLWYMSRILLYPPALCSATETTQMSHRDELHCSSRSVTRKSQNKVSL
jgi:hypothetical protein